MYTVEIKASPGFERFLKNHAAVLDTADQNALYRSLDLLQIKSYYKAPYRFGVLRREIKQIYKEKKLVAGTGLSKKYAPIQEFGGWIYPKNKKVLAWKDKDGTWHHAKKVYIKPKHYFLNTLQENQNEILKIYTEEYGKALQGAR